MGKVEHWNDLVSGVFFVMLEVVQFCIFIYRRNFLNDIWFLIPITFFAILASVSFNEAYCK